VPSSSETSSGSAADIPAVRGAASLRPRVAVLLAAAFVVAIAGWAWINAPRAPAPIDEDDIAVIPPLPPLPAAADAGRTDAAMPAPAALAPLAPAAAPAATPAAAEPAPFVRPLITARTAPGTMFRDCADCPPMVVVPGGSFLMGTPESELGRAAGEGPRQRVTVQPFALATTPVTFEEWDACVAAGACAHRPDDHGWGRGTRPVINVSWQDARAYIAWLSGPATGNYRLPSEAEWEYAARAGSVTPYWWGSEVGTDNANCRGCTGDVDLNQTVPVASFRPNPFGLHDMLGNVWQWVEDCGEVPLVGRPAQATPVLSGQCRDRGLRGGSWESRPPSIRSGTRNADGPDVRLSIFGFRVAKSLP
jgi:formylglycine-generating enzyme required for sulfatase activity